MSTTTSGVFPAQTGITNNSTTQIEGVRDSNTLSIKNIFKKALEPNIGTLEKKSLLENLCSIKGVLEKPNSGIENPEEIAQEVINIITYLESGKSYAKKLWKRGEVRLDEGKLIFSSVLKNILDDECFALLLQSMPKEYREEVTDCCFEERSLQAKSLETLLIYCPNMSKEALDRIIATREESDFVHIVKMWPLFQEVPLEERVSIVKESLKCFRNEQNDSSSNACIIKAISAVPLEDRENVVAWAVTCFHPNSTADERGWIIEAIAAIDAPKRGHVIYWVLVYFNAMPDISKYFNEHMMAGSIPRITVCPSISRAIPAGIITAIAATKVEDREDNISWASQCLDDNDYEVNKIILIETINKIPSEDRTHVLEMALKCFKGCIYGNERIRIINAFIPISSEEREDIVGWILEHFHENVSRNDKIELIELIIAIPLTERQNVLDVVSKCLGEMPIRPQIALIKAILEIDPQDRANVANWASQCFQEKVFLYDRIDVIKTIAAIPSEDRKSVLELSLQIFDSNMLSFKRIGVIKTIAAMNPRDRKDGIKRVIESYLSSI